jgi:ribosomal protein L37AE/L43A
MSNMSEEPSSNRPDPCSFCEPRILKLAPGETWSCPECGVEWAADDRGIWPAEEIDA